MSVKTPAQDERRPRHAIAGRRVDPRDVQGPSGAPERFTAALRSRPRLTIDTA